MALQITLNSVNQVVRQFGVDHVVFALEGRSWRKDFYKPYKANRRVDESKLTQTEIDEGKLFWETYEALTTFLSEKTNASVLRCPIAEADDIIARFIALHPDDQHYIISSDSDFYQLISENVQQYNGITSELITLNGIFDSKNRPVIDKKTKEPKTLGDPQFVLFEKICRGDSSDNVFSAYPGVRTKGSKNKVGITEAFADRNKQGFAYNNFMLQRWLDPDGAEHVVKDDFERNRILIDLSAQPPEVKQAVDGDILMGLNTAHVSGVGFHLLKFAGKYELNKISEFSDQYTRWMNQSYSGGLCKQAT
jgi:5'-3' exonuclease